MKLLLLLLTGVCALAQVEQPSMGVMIDENNRARPVTGAAAAAVLGPPIFDESVISLACSAQSCLAKTDSALISSSGETVDAPPGAALIAFAGETAYVYFVETGQMERWSGGRLFPLDFSPAADVLSIRASSGGFEYAIAREDGIWIGDQNLGPANTVLLLNSGGALLAADEQLRLLRPDGTEVDFAVAASGGFIAGFVRMSDRYVEVITDSGRWILEVEADHEQIFLLPGAAH